MLHLTHQTQVFSLRTCAYLFAGSLAAGTLGYALIEDYAPADALYMAVITISTVGYGEVQPLSGAGRIFTSVYVIANLGITALFISQLTQHLRDGGLITQLRQYLMEREIASLSGHVIVAGGGRYGREIIDQLESTAEDLVLIERDGAIIDDLGERYPRLLFVQADSTTDEALEAAGIRRAKTLIATIGEDSDNAFTVLSARQLAPDITIIARAYEAASRPKFLRVGADHVIQPEQIGSFYMATLVRKPSAVEFFSSLASGSAEGIGFEEILQEDLPPALRNSSLRDMDLRSRTGVSVVALRYADGHYEVNPNPTRTLEDGSSLIALGDAGQLERLRGLIG